MPAASSGTLRGAAPRAALRTVLQGVLLGLVAAAIASPASAQQSAAPAPRGDFETFTPRPSSEAAPADLLSGLHYKVAPTVQTVGYLNNFLVSSDYGVFRAPSDTMLRRLVREIHALAELQKVTRSDAYMEALKQSAMGSVRGVKAFANDPVGTVKAVPTAVFNVFSRAGQGIKSATSGQKTAQEDSAAAQLLQMSSYKRDYARQLGVDPYSSNPVLQKQLESVAWAAAVGNLSVSAVTMASGSTAIQAASYARNLDQARAAVVADPPSELTLRNRKAMDQMGINPSLQQRFLGQKQYSPRAKTILVAALAAMPSTTGKAGVIEAALQAPNEVTAIFYQQLAELLNGYDERVAHITRLERFNRLVLARDAKGKAIIVAPLDWLIWDERAAAAAQKLATTLKARPGGDDVQLWITGTASPRFKEKAQTLGIAVHEKVGSQLPLMD
jgi:hypothetical protein